MALFNDRSLRTIHAESVEYGHTAAPRPHDPTQWNGQQAFRGMPRPTDPALHRLRQSNPSLNDYQFKVNQRAGDTPHGVTARDREGRRVGHLDLGYERMSFEPHPGHREVSGIGVAPDHAGKGLGEAMYDLARMKGSKIVHSDERSESGEAFSRRVGGPALPRRRGHGYDDYLGLNPPSDRV
jgi:GNAT superfamily N-acetyltransferase